MKTVTLRTLAPFLLAAAVVLPPGSAESDVPDFLTHQGRLFDDMGVPITDTLDVTFTLYDGPGVGANVLWTETQSVDFDEGYYSAELGSVTAIDVDALFDGSARWLGVAVDADPEMTPRATVGSVPYAMVAQQVNGDINPTSVSIDGFGPVIDATGAWVGLPTGIAASATGSGFGGSPDVDVGFLAPTVNVTIADGESVLVTSHKALGSTAVGGATSLNLYICYQSTVGGSTIQLQGGGSLGHRVPQDTRITFGLSFIVSGLPAGTYMVGLCGNSSSANWNSNEWGYTTALVFQG